MFIRESDPASDKHFRLRQWLNTVFVVLVVVAVVFYFALPTRLEIFYILGFTAVIVKMAEVCIRMAEPHKNRRNYKR